MKDRLYTICNTEEYDDWLEEQPLKSRLQVLDRISHIREDGHFVRMGILAIIKILKKVFGSLDGRMVDVCTMRTFLKKTFYCC